MRTGLSQRGWNNVLIFASLFMIILFNSTHQKLFEGDNEDEKNTLIPDTGIIQLIDFSGLKFERIGANWRVQSAFDTKQQIQPEVYANNWQSLLLNTLPSAPVVSESVRSFPVLIQALGLDSQQIFLVYLDPDTDLAHIHNKVTQQWFVLNLAELNKLIPHVILPREK